MFLVLSMASLDSVKTSIISRIVAITITVAVHEIYDIIAVVLVCLPDEALSVPVRLKPASQRHTL